MSAMNKSDLVDAVVERSGNYKYVVREVVDDVFEEMQETLADGKKIVIRGFGTFDVKKYDSHPAVHPKTKEPIIVPEYRRVMFTQGDELTRAMRENDSKE